MNKKYNNIKRGMRKYVNSCIIYYKEYESV